MTRKRASHFREKKQNFFAGFASRTANWARVGGENAESASAERFDGGTTPASRSANGESNVGEKKERNGGRRRKGRRRVVVWGVFFASAALALGAADRGASQCFWRRWREARRAPSVRAFYAPTVVGCAPSTSVWAVPRTVAAARPVWSTTGTTAVCSTACSSFPSPPIASAPVCATWTPPTPATVCASTETVASAGYPTQVASTAEVADCGTNGVCGNACADVCSSVATCSDVCAPCGAASTTCVETEYKEEEITTYETVWDNVTRYRDKTITRQVPETSIKREKVKVERPVWETVEKETTYDVTRYVPETSTQTRTRTTLRPVVQMRERKIVETVNQPVVETVMAQRSYVVNRPTTTYRTETRDYGGFETRITAVPGRERCCLRWRCGGDYWDPTTGRTRYRLPGLYWTPTQEPTEYRAQKVYRPNLVATQVPVTTYVPETVVENVPTTRTTFRPVQVERTVSEPTTVYVRDAQTEVVPVTTYKPVTERVVKKTPTRVLRTQTTEEIRETPVTTYKTVTEIVREPYVERVARQVPKTTKVMRPVYKTVVPVSTRYLPEETTAREPSANVETFETVETFRTETTDVKVEKRECCEPSGTSRDAADFAPSLTSRTTTEARSADATGPNLPSAVPDVRRAARPITSVDEAPPVVSPTSDKTASTTNEQKEKESETTSFETFEATFEEAETPESTEVAERLETSDAGPNLPLPTVAPTRATSEGRR
ncbi:MAG: hypothetical protein J6K20_09680 [Thermoguttaceae bacterium]|nr:hypothetical protein [Thermoguttaceae bacterium]